MGRFNTTFIIGGPLVCNCQANDPSLVLDLQFASDQAYVSRRGPLPTFTRASAAWRVNSAGVIVPAAINEARIDCDPTTLACLGLLIEEQRTNLSIHSENAIAANWGKSNVSVSVDQGVSPGGTVDADLVSETAASGFHTITTPGVATTSGTTYALSLWLKKGTGATAPDWILLALSNQFPASVVAFNLTTGAFGSVVGASFTYRAVSYTGGWWRVVLVSTAALSSTANSLTLYFTNNVNTASAPSYAGQTTSNIFVWGAQVEAGSFATSYIPTTTTSVVRSADVCSIIGSAFTSFYNQSEGTLVFRGIKQALQPTVTPSYLGVDDATAGNSIILYGGSAESANVDAGGVAQANVGGVTQAAALTSFAIAMRYKANDFAFCLNGGAVSADTSGTVPTVTQMLVGNRLGSSFMGGWIQSVQYYNQIKSNAQLQTLSTP